MGSFNGSKYVYFILVGELQEVQWVGSPGSICCIEENMYTDTFSDSKNPQKLPIKFINEYSTFYVDVDLLQPLKEKELGLLNSIEHLPDRLKCFLEREQLDFALSLETDKQVSVEINSEWCQGVVRYIGKIMDPIARPSYYIPPIYFGIELQGKDEGKGSTDGSYHGTRHFTCKYNCGIFVTLTKLRAATQQPRRAPDTEGSAGDEPVNPGDQVHFFIDETIKQGLVIGLQKKDAKTYAMIATDGEQGNTNLTLPLECVIKDELLSPAADSNTDTRMDWEAPPKSSQRQSGGEWKSQLVQNSVVEVSLEAERLMYGTIRWIGTLPEREGLFAGLELEEDKGVSDGSFKGLRKFFCPPKRGLFVKLQSCHPDSRFQSSPDQREMATRLLTEGKEGGRAITGAVPPLDGDRAVQVLKGKMRGIQGHCNSCYMDSALFSLFSCSSVLDSMLFKSPGSRDADIQNTLREEIVNPLRTKGFVAAHSVMKLRKQLKEGGHCASFTTDEKDPEEFLSLIMHHILKVDPLLKLQSVGQKEQEAYCYQIFIDQSNSLVLPTVQQLLEYSFHNSSLRLAEVPSCLVLQMPRFGKKFKLFEKIMPSLELDLTDLLCNSPRECIVCGGLASQECMDCFTDQTFSNAGFKQFCDKCSEQVHSHPQRRDHKLPRLSLPEGFRGGNGAAKWRVPREKLELFAVLCIETSHYVSFVRYGPQKDDWIFFDSMADRHGDQDGYNIPTVTLCPEVGRYLDMPLTELAGQTPRDMEGVAKRLFCDAYMYLYQSKRMELYK